MSAQIGRWNFTRELPGSDFIVRATGLIAPYGPDTQSRYQDDAVQIVYGAHHTTSEAAKESQPCVLNSGSVLTWDGRLDNRDELISTLRSEVTSSTTDVALVAAAITRWGTTCLPKLIGDWAFSLWNPAQQSLLLARDFAGVRQLYYRAEKSRILWSTVLDALVFLAEHPLTVNEEYVAGWLSLGPATRLTPYNGINAVPPACSVLVKPREISITQFWDFGNISGINYRNDAEYEQHFRAMFTQSVRRRMRANRPVLAELSGGMDSSSIVCVADHLVSADSERHRNLETISYFSDTEPHWNERPYFSEVERKRGKAGWHIDVSSRNVEGFILAPQRFAPTPSSLSYPNEEAAQFVACVSTHNCRVLLSGVGGDEFTGGVPTPIPELADLVVRAQISKLVHQLRSWAIVQRRPWPHLLLETIQCFLPLSIVGTPKHRKPPRWLTNAFQCRYRSVLAGYPRRTRIFGQRPSLQEHLDTFDVVRRQLSSATLSAKPLLEIRYPFLDRDLLSFLFALPREQLVRPGHRRSLMRRALAGIVPALILERKRKAYVSRRPFLDLAALSSDVCSIQKELVTEALHILDADRFMNAIRESRLGTSIDILWILRTLNLEVWLRSLDRQGIIRSGGSHNMTASREVKGTL